MGDIQALTGLEHWFIPSYSIAGTFCSGKVLHKHK